tara:strand:+ start:3059 stop:3772 length:714 start_codon:yes stop_codon:yes gene_type:complete
MNIDYVIISSDNNPIYRDFYEPVSKVWNHFGYKTFMLEICDEDSEIYETEYGIYKKFKKVGNIDCGLQSQIVRLFASTLLPDSNLLMSDIDMFPLTINYFEERSKLVTDEQILIYTGQPYGTNGFYPMCYILGNGGIISKSLGIENDTYEDFTNKLYKDYKGAWNTDENFFFDKMQLFDNKIILRDRVDILGTRVYRPVFRYTEEQIKRGYFIDCHSLRPYNTHKTEIDKLINLIVK